MSIRYKYVLKIRYKDNEIVQIELYNMKYTLEKGKTTPLNYFCLCNFKCDINSIVETTIELEKHHKEINTGADSLYSTVRYMYQTKQYEVINNGQI